MTHWAHQNIFPEPFIQLNQEIVYHPKLQALLANHPMAEWEIKLAEICLYCEVIVDGTYLPEELEKLCVILRDRLILKREDNRKLIIINSLDSST